MKRKGPINRLREDIAPKTSGDKTLRSNHWAIKGASLQSFLEHWIIFQELWNRILERRKTRFRSLTSSHRSSNAEAKFKFLFWNTTGSAGSFSF